MKIVQRYAVRGGKFSLLAVLGVFLSVSPIFGEGFSKVPSGFVNEIVVTADKSESSVLKVPSGVSVLYGDDMKASGARVVADCLHMVPGLQLEDVEGNGVQTQMTMRGMPHGNSNYILVLVDGIPQSVATSEVHWASIPMEIVDRIEVVRGPGSSLYGMNAMGGVINIITREPSQDFEVSLQGGIGSYGENRQVVGVSGSKERTAYLLSAKRTASEGWREKNNETLAYHLFGKITHEFNEKARISFNANISDWDNDWPDFIPADEWHAGVRKKVFYDANETAQKIDLSTRFDYSVSKHLHLSNRLYGQFMDKEWRNIVNVIDDDVDFFGMGDEIQAELSRDMFGRTNKLLFGFQWEYKEGSLVRKFSQLFSSASLRGQKMNDTESSIHSFALYIHDIIDLTDKLSLSTGVRYDFVDIEYEDKLANKGSQTDDYDHISPKLGFSYSVNNDVSLFANVGTGFKSPSASVIAKSPGIEPEKLLSYEGGLKASLSDRFSLQIVAYFSELTDQISGVHDPDSPTGYKMVNAGESEMKGVELEAQWFVLDNLVVSGSYTYNESKYSHFLDQTNGDLSNKFLAWQPKNKITGEIRYFHESGFSASLTAKWLDEQYMSPANEYAMDDYFSSDAKISYDWNNGLILSLAVRNLFDADYASHAENWGGGDVYYTPAAPRTFLLEASFSF